MERDQEGQEDPYDDRDRKSAEGNYWNANEVVTISHLSWLLVLLQPDTFNAVGCFRHGFVSHCCTSRPLSDAVVTSQYEDASSPFSSFLVFVF